MRCQICNKETESWSLNKKTGEYESICSKCRRVIIDTNSYYKNFENCDNLDELDDKEFIDYLKEVDYIDKGGVK